MSVLQILCACYHNSSANSLKALAHNLQAFAQVRLAIVAYGPAVATLQRAGLDFIALSDTDLRAEVLSRMMAELKPQVLVVGSSKTSDERPTLEQIATATAAQQGIFSISLLDYIGSPQKPRYFTKDRYYIPDLIVAPDAWSKDKMTEEGFAADKIVVLGNPQFDAVARIGHGDAAVDRRRLRDKLQLAAAHRDFFLVQFVGCVRQDRLHAGCQRWDYDYITALGDGLSPVHTGGKKIALLLRPHPREVQTCPENWQKVIAKANTYPMPVYSVALELSPDEVSLACDLTVVSRSNIATQNVFMGLPTLSIQLEDASKDDLGVTQMGVVPVAYDEQTAQKLIFAAFQQADFWQTYHDRRALLMAANTGRSGEKVARLVYDIACGSSAEKS